jgi:hypothetical protein
MLDTPPSRLSLPALALLGLPCSAWGGADTSRDGPILSLLVATLSTVGIFLRLRTLACQRSICG